MPRHRQILCATKCEKLSDSAFFFPVVPYQGAQYVHDLKRCKLRIESRYSTKSFLSVAAPWWVEIKKKASPTAPPPSLPVGKEGGAEHHPSCWSLGISSSYTFPVAYDHTSPHFPASAWRFSRWPPIRQAALLVKARDLSHLPNQGPSVASSPPPPSGAPPPPPAI